MPRRLRHDIFFALYDGPSHPSIMACVVLHLFLLFSNGEALSIVSPTPIRLQAPGNMAVTPHRQYSRSITPTSYRSTPNNQFMRCVSKDGGNENKPLIMRLSGLRRVIGLGGNRFHTSYSKGHRNDVTRKRNSMFRLKSQRGPLRKIFDGRENRRPVIPFSASGSCLFSVANERTEDYVPESEAKAIVITDEDEIENKEELKVAVQEVKEAIQEVQQSAVKLKLTVIEKGPDIVTRFFRKVIRKEMREDLVRIRKNYASDFTDAFRNKSQVIPAILFLYFACLAPTVSFGTIAMQITNGSIGVVEFLLSCGLSGMAYALIAGQPMGMLAPTGLTLAFISGLFRFCTLKSLPFFPVYTWVGLWTSFFMIILGFGGASRLIRYCTHFTDEIFNGLLSVNFIYEALASLQRNFAQADPTNLTMPFVALAMALTTFWSTMQVLAFNTSRYLSQKARTLIKDFGPVAIIVLMTIFNRLSWLKQFGVPTLSVPPTFQLAGGRDFLIPYLSIPMDIRILCALPAALLTGLFFMDQNISIRLVNKPENGLKKGTGYNADMVALGIITGGLSIVGLPWMCGATVQSMNHVRAMTTYKFNEETENMDIEKVTETRFTGFFIHAMIAATVCVLPILSNLPIPVVSGVFLFLGRKLMSGNSFLIRIKDSFAETKRLPDDHPVRLRVISRNKMNLFTSIQVCCLLGLWKFKQIATISIFFPSMIGFLIVIRKVILPRFFTEEEFIALGDPTPSTPLPIH